MTMPSATNSRGRARRTRHTSSSSSSAQSTHSLICEAIRGHQMISLHYQGNPRRIIPLVFGELKNGRQAVLCYKYNGPNSHEPEIVLRLYHLEKISHVESLDIVLDVNRKIDYYLTKHFAAVYQKC